MPLISRFYGIRIYLRLNDHDPPHFHASYQGEWASIRIENGALIEGRLPPRARRLVVTWARRNVDKLLANWERVRSGLRPERIPPLE